MVHEQEVLPTTRSHPMQRDVRAELLGMFRERAGFVALVLFWVFCTLYLGPVIYLVLPASVLFLAVRGQWDTIVFGFLIVLVLSDISVDFIAMRKLKTAKYGYILAMTLLLAVKREHFQPFSRLFLLFLPFFVYCFIPLLSSPIPLLSVQKQLSYALLFLVVPNYMLLCKRLYGSKFLKDLVFIIVLLYLGSLVLDRFQPNWTNVGDRHRGVFGNPNGLGIFSYLAFVLISLIFHLHRDLYPRIIRIAFLGLVVYFLIKSGSRASLTAMMIYLVFSRFFSLSPFLGVVAFLSFVGIYELLASNLEQIVFALGLEEYLRVETLSTGSGRYVAWQFAWERIQEVFLFGGGFGLEEYVMRKNLDLLSLLGHQGGVHNSYLTLWFNAGIIGIIIFFRSFFLLFFKANRFVPVSFAIMFSVMFSVMYESWLMGSLNPYTIVLVMAMTITTEPEMQAGDPLEDAEERWAPEPEDPDRRYF